MPTQSDTGCTLSDHFCWARTLAAGLAWDGRGRLAGGKRRRSFTAVRERNKRGRGHDFVAGLDRRVRQHGQPFSRTLAQRHRKSRGQEADDKLLEKCSKRRRPNGLKSRAGEKGKRQRPVALFSYLFNASAGETNARTNLPPGAVSRQAVVTCWEMARHRATSNNCDDVDVNKSFDLLLELASHPPSLFSCQTGRAGRPPSRNGGTERELAVPGNLCRPDWAVSRPHIFKNRGLAIQKQPRRF